MSYSQRKSRDTTTRTYSKPTKQRDAEQYSTGSSEVNLYLLQNPAYLPHTTYLRGTSFPLY